jgi:hypothetical protein
MMVVVHGVRVRGPLAPYAEGLPGKLAQPGFRPSSGRLFQLAAELPAALLARMPGIRITTAVAWQRAGSGDWTSYAAGVSRRTGAGMTPRPETAGP